LRLIHRASARWDMMTIVVIKCSTDDSSPLDDC